LAGNLPIFCEFYHWMEKQGPGITTVSSHAALETGMARLAEGMNRTFQSPCDEARVSFWKAFKIDGTSQRLIEEHYRNLPPVSDAVLELSENTNPTSVVYRSSCTSGLPL